MEVNILLSDLWSQLRSGSLLVSDSAPIRLVSSRCEKIESPQLSLLALQTLQTHGTLFYHVLLTELYKMQMLFYIVALLAFLTCAEGLIARNSNDTEDCQGHL